MGSVENQRRRLVLEMLADAGARGRTDPEFLARFTPELLDLVTGGLATAECEVAISGGRPFEVARIRITERGWRAIDECVSPAPPGRAGVRCLTGSRTTLRKREISCSSVHHMMWRTWSRRTASPFDGHQISFCLKKQKIGLFAK
jgi:hypothetical protein